MRFIFAFACGWLMALGQAFAVRVVVVVPAATPPDARVYVAGSLASVGACRADGLALTRGEDGRFTGDVPIAVGETLAFKITRGSWATVEKKFDGSERPNRAASGDQAGDVGITVERWADTARGSFPATSRPSGVVGDLRIVTVGDGAAQRTLRVWLPPGYATGDDRYPVLYLHDGQNLFDPATSAFGNEWGVDETLTKLAADKTIQPLIVVGIDNVGARRIDEYTTTPDNGRGGNGAAYERFVVEAVKPLVDKSYRTASDREHTFVGGSSLGGLISLDLVRRYPQIFGGAIAMSPSLWWDDEALTRSIESDAKPLTHARVWLDMGDREGDEAAKRAAYVLQARRLTRALDAAHVKNHLTIDPEGEHNEAAWARRFPDAIQYLLAH